MNEPLSVTQDQIEHALIRIQRDAFWVTGFFVAVQTGPRIVAPTDWIPRMIPDEFVDNQDAAATLVPLLYLHDHVAAVLRKEPTELCPAKDDADAITEWCGGYLEGARLHPAWVKEPATGGALAVICALSGEVPVSEIRDPGDASTDEEWLDRQRLELRDCVRECWLYWAPTRKTAALAVRAQRQVGRNDPCPCGSGKKYKKCCLEATAG